MSSPQIDTFLIDDINESKFASHGLSVRQIIQVLENTYIIVPNRKYRRGLYLVIGRDNGGSFISIPIEDTSDANIWRPITAWPCKKSEITAFERKGNRSE
jgi:hypothetical protein